MESNHCYLNADQERFQFGKNWKNFLRLIDEDRIQQSIESLQTMLDIDDFSNKRFLDIGCGSGLSSLAAYRLGANVYSIDYDFVSVECTRYLQKTYADDKNDNSWIVEQGSVLDHEYLNQLDPFDIVYSWGVLHHTGSMWEAMENITPLVKTGGFLYISIYNNQGWKSKMWKMIKKTYNILPKFCRTPYVLAVMIPREIFSIFHPIYLLRPNYFVNHIKNYILSWTNYHHNRGMSRWHDMVDWVGGYPFEVAKPEDVFDFYRKRGFTLERLFTCAGGLGCNEYVFKK